MPADATLKRTQTQFTQAQLTGEAAQPLPLRDRIGDWIFPPKGVEQAPVSLSQRRIYILPTKAGILFAMTLALMLLGSINYNLSLGYGLTFLLAGTGVVSMLHTWRNLAHLKLRPGKTEPVFAGGDAAFTVVIDNRGRVTRRSLAVSFGNFDPTFTDIEAGSELNIQVRIPAPRRGIFRPGRFRVFTTYPLGLFYSWANVELDLTCLVYPAPEVGDIPLPEMHPVSGPGSTTGRGEEDFAGLRNYRPGDSLRRIAWKSVARNDVFATKLFSGASGTQLWLDYADIPESLGLEQRLSRMTRWVLDATHAGQYFGLRLPDQEIEFGTGEAQQTRCLEALALYRLPDRR